MSADALDGIAIAVGMLVLSVMVVFALADLMEGEGSFGLLFFMCLIGFVLWRMV